MAGWGLSTAGAIVGGSQDSNPTMTAETLEWNGSSWTAGGDYSSVVKYFAAFGTADNGIAAGGSTGSANLSVAANYNGTSWTEVAELASVRRGNMANGASGTSGLTAGGETPPGAQTNVTEEWSYPPSTSSILLEGQMWFNSSSSALKVYGTAAGIPSGSWASGGALNTARYGSGASGLTQNSSLVFAGYTTTNVANNESYNGTAWTELNDVNTARSNTAGTGTQTAALLFGGTTGSVTNATEKWDGSSWTTVGSLNTARRYLGSAGTQTAALAVGGYDTTQRAFTESWDGSSWTEIADLNTARYGLGGAGVQTSAVGFGGNDGGYAGETEKWDGSSWTESGDLNTARTELGALGEKTLALAFGGTTGSVSATTEIYNGTSWTELSDLATARQRIALGPAGSSAAGLAAGGYAGSDPGVANTEEWTAPATVSTVTTS
jgi:hypothetical protein